jgi:hypothetical protein
VDDDEELECMEMVLAGDDEGEEVLEVEDGEEGGREEAGGEGEEEEIDEEGGGEEEDEEGSSEGPTGKTRSASEKGGIGKKRVATTSLGLDGAGGMQAKRSRKPLVRGEERAQDPSMSVLPPLRPLHRVDRKDKEDVTQAVDYVEDIHVYLKAEEVGREGGRAGGRQGGRETGRREVVEVSPTSMLLSTLCEKYSMPIGSVFDPSLLPSLPSSLPPSLPPPTRSNGQHVPT